MSFILKKNNWGEVFSLKMGQCTVKIQVNIKMLVLLDEFKIEKKWAKRQMWLKTNSWEGQPLHLVSDHLSFPELPQYPSVGLQTQSADGYSDWFSQYSTSWVCITYYSQAKLNIKSTTTITQHIVQYKKHDWLLRMKQRLIWESKRKKDFNT